MNKTHRLILSSSVLGLIVAAALSVGVWMLFRHPPARNTEERNIVRISAAELVPLADVPEPPDQSPALAAIFDTSLPDREREDLMEDLNEEGLSDKKRPGPDDLPLIMNRIALIEEIASDAD